MTKDESKLAKQLDHRLQEQARQATSSFYRSETKAENLNIVIHTRARTHSQTIQRAQFFTGDA